MVRFVRHVRGFMLTALPKSGPEKPTGTDHLLYKISGAGSHTPSELATELEIITN